MPETINLRAQSNSLVAMAFGMAVAAKPGVNAPGTLAVLADELTRRGILRDLLAGFTDERRGIITLAITVDRSRRRTGGR